jgi:transcription-repair coupling factor (superfamily II helicase)
MMPKVVEASVAAARELHSLADQLERHTGFAEVLASLSAGHGGTLGGVWGSSCALVAAALEKRAPQTLVVVLPHIRDLDSLCDDLSLFTNVRVQQFPAWETDAGERVLNDEIYGQ